jgi:hypothetical protein
VQSAIAKEKQAAEALTNAEENKGWVWLIFPASIWFFCGPSQHGVQSLLPAASRSEL